MANVADHSSARTGSEDSSVDSTDPSRPESLRSGGAWAGLFPDLSTVDWYLDPRFQRYWKHYHQVMGWYKKHVETYEMLSSRLNSGSAVPGNRNSARFNPYANLHRGAPKSSGQIPGCSAERSAWSVPGGQQRMGKESATKTRPFSNPNPRTSPGVGSSPSTSTERSEVSHTPIAPQQSGHEEFEMEITDEMVEFFEQSRKHKQLREEAKKQSNPGLSEEEHVDIEKASGKRPATTQAPTERPGLRRTKEMKLLYGKGAAMIHGMETATQMTFDRNTDLHKPKLWPNMPLKIVFS